MCSGAAFIFSQPSCARATPCPASSPNTPDNAILGNPNNGIPKPFAPFSPAFTSLSLMAPSPFSSEIISGDAGLRHERLVEAESCPASVFDQLLDELQSSPDATLSDEKGAVRSISDSPLKSF